MKKKKGEKRKDNPRLTLNRLLALFGDRFATQYMSQTLVWPDHVILAMAPLGILAAAMGAIRVGGPVWLRALLGRARETRAAVELELMSSTSHEVCELFNGRHIVRCLGKPLLAQFLCFKISGKYQIHTLKTAVESGLLRPHSTPASCITFIGKLSTDLQANIRTELTGPFISSHDQVGDPETGPKNDLLYEAAKSYLSSSAAPNMALNLSDCSSVKHGRKLFLLSLLSTLVQVAVLVVSALSVHYAPMTSLVGEEVTSHGFPVFVTGTVCLVMGMMLCSWTIDGGTSELAWSRTEKNEKTDNDDDDDDKIGVIWIQKSQTVSDQTFPSYAIIGGLKERIITSTRKESSRYTAKDREEALTTKGLASCGALFAAAGFLVQLQGLRNLTWPSSVAQLVAVVTMAVIRAWIRRDIGNAPVNYRILEEHELDWLAYNLAQDELPPTSKECSISSSLFTSSNKDKSDDSDRKVRWNIATAGRGASMGACLGSPGHFTFKPTSEEPDDDDMSIENRILQHRQTLDILANWKSSVTENAVILHNSIIRAMNHLFPEDDPQRTHVAKDFPFQTTIRIYPDSIPSTPASTISPQGWDSPVRTSPPEDVIYIYRNYDVEEQYEEEDRILVAESPVEKSHASQEHENASQSDKNSDSRKDEGKLQLHDRFTWSVQVSARSESDTRHGRVNIKVDYDKNSKYWTVDPIQLDALLSLWKASLKYLSIDTRSGANKDPLDQDDSEMSHWRILGADQTSAMHRESSWYSDISQIRRLVENGKLLQSSPEFANPQTSHAQSLSEVRPLIIGFHGLEPSEANPPDMFDWMTPPRADRNTGFYNWKRYLWSYSPATLADKTTAPMSRALSQHIFSSFLWAVAPSFPEVLTQEVELVTNLLSIFGTINSANDTPIRLSNPGLDRLAAAIHQGGIYYSSQESIVNIVPPLSRLRKLPRQAPVDCIRKKLTRELESQNLWTQPSTMYLWLLESCRSCTPCRHCAAVTVAIIEYIYICTEARDPFEKLLGSMESVPSLKAGLKSFLDAAGSQGLFLIELQWFYTLQQREYVLEAVYGTFELEKNPRLDFKRLNLENWGLTPSHLAAAEGTDSLRVPRQMQWYDAFGWSMWDYAALSFDRPKRHVTLPNILLSIRRMFEPGFTRTDVSGRTVLHHAIRMNLGLDDFLNLTKEAKDMVVQASKVITRDGMNFLHIAAKNGGHDLVHALIQQGIDDVNSRDRWGRTALHFAALGGHIEVIKQLIESGADISLSSEQLSRFRPLHVAAACNNSEMLELLIDKEGDWISWTASGRMDALEVAATMNSVQAFEKLVYLALQLLTTSRTKHAQPPADDALADEPLEAVASETETLDNESKEDSCVDPKSSFHQHRYWRRSVRRAAGQGHTQILSKMLELSEGDAREYTWSLALSTGILTNKIDTCRYLMGNRQQEQVWEDGNQEQGLSDMEKLTIKIPGASSDPMTDAPIPMVLTTDELQGLLVDFVYKQRVPGSPLVESFKRGHDRVVIEFLNNPAVQSIIKDTEAADDNSVLFTILWDAVSYGTKDVVEFLLQTYPTLVINAESLGGERLLSTTMDLDLVRFLLKQDGTDINAQDYNGNTALSHACRGGNTEKARLLLAEPDIDVNTTNDDGWTPFMIAEEKGREEMAKMILERSETVEEIEEDSGRP